VFDQHTLEKVRHTKHEWLKVAPVARNRGRWWVRSREVTGTTVFVIIEPGASDLKNHPISRALLETQEEPSSQWPFEHKVLIVDRFEVLRRVYSEALEERGCNCYRAETATLATKLVRADSDIGVVVVESRWPNLNLAAFVAELRQIRPGLKIVATGVVKHGPTPVVKGVDFFIAKPWSIDQLVELLRAN
jgi:CheY-like chemotaxis protein